MALIQVPESREEAQPVDDPIVERVVMPFIRESTLWPVLIVLFSALLPGNRLAGSLP